MRRMMSRSAHLVLLCMAAFIIAGCTSVPMPKGTSKGYATVRFIKPNEPLAEDNLPQFIEAHRMIKESVVDQMQQHGLQVVDHDADLIVAYLVVLQDNVKTFYSNQYYGSQDFMPIVNTAFKERAKKSYPENIQKRIVVIDLIDAGTYKLVYRDYAVTGAVADLPEAERRQVIGNVVSAALQQFFK